MRKISRDIDQVTGGGLGSEGDIDQDQGYGGVILGFFRLERLSDLGQPESENSKTLFLIYWIKAQNGSEIVTWHIDWLTIFLPMWQDLGTRDLALFIQQDSMLCTAD